MKQEIIILQRKNGRQIAALCEAYEKVILVVNTGGLIDLAFTDEFPNITAVLQFVQAGQEGGNALADVILRKSDSFRKAGGFLGSGLYGLSECCIF